MDWFVLILGLVLPPAILAAVVFWAIWKRIGTRQPMKAGLICFALGMAAPSIVTTMLGISYFSPGDGAIFTIPTIAPAAFGILSLIVGLSSGLRNGLPRIREVLNLVLQNPRC